MDPTRVLSPAEQWFVARTRYFRQEIKIRDWLMERGVETFVPTLRSECKDPSGKRRYTEKPAAPNLVFLKTDKATACSFITVEALPMQYVRDCATHRMMVVPEKAMSDFQRVFDLSKDRGGLVDQPLTLGERVRITRGALRGVEGYITDLLGRVYVVVGLMNVLWAKAQVPRAWLEAV